MRRNVVSAVLFLVAVAAVLGCTDKKRMKYATPHKEECILPPDPGQDARFDKPPSAEWRARVKPTEDKSTLMKASQMNTGPQGGRGGI